MKAEPGRIRIKDNKVYFEPDRLSKPLIRNYPYDGFRKVHFDRDMKLYEASKKLLRVSNAEWSEDNKNITALSIQEKVEYIKNNQKCEAEIKDNKATIISLIK